MRNGTEQNRIEPLNLCSHSIHSHFSNSKSQLIFHSLQTILVLFESWKWGKHLNLVPVLDKLSEALNI